jgi:uncharacterized protein (DUF1800 family)
METGRARGACARRSLRRALLGVLVSSVLAACGGGSSTSQPTDLPATRAEAARFLTQATFGPTDAAVDHVMSVGYSAWIDEQFATPAASHLAAWDAANAAAKAADPVNGGAGQDAVLNSFWKQAVAGDDQLRQRVAYSLSQIFVVSMQDGSVGDAVNTRGVAAYFDMLGDKGLGNYRDLLEAVSLHPIMGMYLTSMRNQKADPRTGRVPDENYAREVMQLFSIGLLQLNSDGSEKLSAGLPVETYTAADVAGIAKVFTGWSWACGKTDSGCFASGASGGVSDPDRIVKAMQGYAQYHSTEEKKFLGVTVPAQGSANPAASLKAGVDAMYNHPNVGPFIGRQLIQRLVTSNPSPSYVAAVAAAFDNNGAGVRGDMKAVIRAVLRNPEARSTSDRFGKLREPVLRLSAFLRAFRFTSDSGGYRVGNTDNPGTQLGQSPLRAPTVFNFYRPGYVPPGTQAASARLVVPEMQITHETSASGYVNYMRDNVAQGVGQFNGGSLNRRDLQPDFGAELALADKPAELVDRLNAKLTYGTMPAELKAEIQGAVEKMLIPALTPTNQKQVDDAKRARVNAAIFLTLVSPEFQIQK